VRANQTYRAGLERCCLPLSDGGTLVPALLAAGIADEGSAQEPPHDEADLRARARDAACVVRTITQNVSTEVQAALVRHVVSLPLLDSRGRGVALQLAAAVLASVRTEVLEADPALLEDVTRRLCAAATAGPDAAHDAASSAAAMALAAVLNKCDATRHAALLDECVVAVLAGCAAGPAAREPFPRSRERAVHALAWLAKGLCMRGHAKGKELTARVVAADGSGLICDADPAVARAAAEFFGAVLRPCDEALCKASHARETLLFRQRFFADSFADLRARLGLRAANAPGDELGAESPASPRGDGGGAARPLLLLAALHLVEFAPRAIVLGELPLVLPLLVMALTGAERDRSASAISSSSSTNRADAARANTAQVSDAARRSALVSLALVVSAELDAVDPFLLQLVPALLSLTQYHPGLPARHRVLALDCLLAIASLPYNKIHALRPKVARQLLVALDDPKRPVRAKAVQCRNRWITLHNA
jgi:hypothetical protein